MPEKPLQFFRIPRHQHQHFFPLNIFLLSHVEKSSRIIFTSSNRKSVQLLESIFSQQDNYITEEREVIERLSAQILQKN